MAKEILLGVTITFKKGGAQVSRSESIAVNVTGDAFSHETQSIGTSNVALALGTALGTPGYIFIKNLDAVNYVEVGNTNAYAIKLKAGEVALYRHDGTPFAKANTAACLVEYLIIED